MIKHHKSKVILTGLLAAAAILFVAGLTVTAGAQTTGESPAVSDNSPVDLAGATSAQTASLNINEAPNISSHADATTQSSQVTFTLPPVPVTCQFDTGQVEDYGVTITDVSISGSDKVSTQFQNGTVDLAVESGDSTETATVTLTMDTRDVQIPDQPVAHTAECSAGSLSADTATVTTQLGSPLAEGGEFDLTETGIKNTSDTAVAQDDGTIEQDTTMTQSVDLDLVVPDDGDADGDIYNVTIDTRESLASGVNVTGASVENDPSGADQLVEVVDSPNVTDDENVTLDVREAAANHSDGDLSRETITVALELDATGDAFTAGEITHVIDDEAGNETATVSYESAAGDDGPEKSVGDYTNQQNVVKTGNLQNAVSDWRTDVIEIPVLQQVVTAWRSGDPVS